MPEAPPRPLCPNLLKLFRPRGRRHKTGEARGEDTGLPMRPGEEPRRRCPFTLFLAAARARQRSEAGETVELTGERGGRREESWLGKAELLAYADRVPSQPPKN